MFKSDAKYQNRKWRKPDAERRWNADAKKSQTQYRARREGLVALIVQTVEQKHVNGHLCAPDIWSLLLLLKEEVDCMPGGLNARQPWSDRFSTEGERAQFMSDAFRIALNHGKVKIYSDPEQPSFWLYAEHKAKWLMHRDGQVIANYIPTKEELAVPDEGFDSSPALPFTDRHRSRFQHWGESVDQIA